MQQPHPATPNEPGPSHTPAALDNAVAQPSLSYEAIEATAHTAKGFDILFEEVLELRKRPQTNANPEAASDIRESKHFSPRGSADGKNAIGRA